MNRLPRELRELLETDLGSLEKLDAISQLRRAGGAMPRAELARALHLDREAVSAMLDELARAGLVELTAARGAVRLGPAAARPPCEALLRIYDEDRPQIAAMLSSLAVQRIRRMAARAFGEALVSKKKPSKDEGER